MKEYSFLNSIKMMAEGNIDFRSEALRDEINDIIIDTVCPTDTNKWETGINKNDKWYIVEQYVDSLQATKGHEKWISLIKENPDTELKDVLIDKFGW